MIQDGRTRSAVRGIIQHNRVADPRRADAFQVRPVNDRLASRPFTGGWEAGPRGVGFPRPHPGQTNSRATRYP
jgi:hypothetical protein